MSRDGKRRTTVRASFRLDRENLADILCYLALSHGWDPDGRPPSAAWLEGQIRAELEAHGMGQWPYWRDELPGDDQAAAVQAWVARQVARLAPAGS
jgi:hypothetical protein